MMVQKAVFPILIVFLLSGGVSAQKYSGGTGEPNDPYRIATANDLNDIGNHIEDYNKCFVLVNDINLAEYTGTQFNIIGDQGNPFTGVFDGNGHTVSGFTYTIANADNVGLFGYVCNDAYGQIKGLTLADPNVEVGTGKNIGGLVGTFENGRVEDCGIRNGSVHGRHLVGGLVGEIRDGTIDKCCTIGTVVGGKSACGGLAGGNYSGTIVECYGSGAVSGSSWGAGGLVGESVGTVWNCYATSQVSAGQYGGGLAGLNSGTITNSYSTGETSSMHDAGGLVGNNYGRVTYSYWDIETSGQSTSAGGEGKTSAEMKAIGTFCHWATEPAVWTINDGNDRPHLAWEQKPGATINSPRLSDFLSGSGAPDDPYLVCTSDDFDKVTFYGCEWDKCYKLMGDIDLEGPSVEDCNIIASFSGVFDGNGHTISGFSHTSTSALSGLFGYVYGEQAYIGHLGLNEPNVQAGYYMACAGALVGCLENGTVNGCWVRDAVVSGWLNIGGLVGQNNGQVKNSSVTGVISGDWYVGGLVGDNKGQIIACRTNATVLGLDWQDDVGGLVGRNHAEIISSSAIGTVDGGFSSFVGGLVGENWAGAISNSYAIAAVSGQRFIGGLVGGSADTLISSCYAAGPVAGNEVLGGLVASGDPGLVQDSMWDLNATGQSSSSGGMGLPTAEMQEESTFTDAGWDFVEVWDIGENQTYPYLRVYPAGDLNHDGRVDFFDVAILADDWLEGK